MKRRILAVLAAAAVMVLCACPGYAAEDAQAHGAVHEHCAGGKLVEIIEKPDDGPAVRASASREGRAQWPADLYGTPLSDSVYYYRSLYTERGQQLYDEIYTGLMNADAQISFSRWVPKSDADDLLVSVLNDHPEILWVGTRWYFNMRGTLCTGIEPVYNGLEADREGTQRRMAEASAPVLRFAAGFPNQVEKVKVIHDWITHTTDYDLDSACNQSAYSALVNGSSICAGYARAFQYCMQMLGIRVAYVTSLEHAWNMVELDGEHYGMDVTWDDPSGHQPDVYEYDYFNVTDHFLLGDGDHIREEICRYLPVATGTKYSYDNYFGGNAYGTDFSALEGGTAPGPGASLAPGSVATELAGVRAPNGLHFTGRDGYVSLDGVPIGGPHSSQHSVQELTGQTAVPSGARTEVLGTDGVTMDGGSFLATGQTLVVRNADGSEVMRAVVVMQGDALGSGKMSVSQLVRVAAAMRGREPIEPGPYFAAADMNSDGSIGLADLVAVAGLLVAA